MKRQLIIKFENLPSRASISPDEISKIFGGCVPNAQMCIHGRTDCCLGTCYGNIFLPDFGVYTGVCVNV